MDSRLTQVFERSLAIEPALAGARLDQALAALLPEISRSRLQRWIDQGLVRVDGRPRRCRDKVWGGERVQVAAELVLEGDCRAQQIDLTVVFEDEHLLVVDKPAGLVVHPAAGNPDGTLQNALLHHDPSLATLPRCGIVHRLDKDTSGLLVVAKTLLAHKSLVAQLQSREVHREYRALVNGSLAAGGSVNAPIGRHPKVRTKMAVVQGGREAVTHYRVLEGYPGHTLLSVKLETGRTHQIRVHMAHIRHSLVGDPAYGGRSRVPSEYGPDLTLALQRFPRQALHAIRLGLIHPERGESLQWEVPMASDLEDLLGLFRQEKGLGADLA